MSETKHESEVIDMTTRMKKNHKINIKTISLHFYLIAQTLILK